MFSFLHLSVSPINFLHQAPPPHPTTPVLSCYSSALSFFPLPLFLLPPPPKVGDGRTSGESQAALQLLKPPRQAVETMSRRSIVSPEPQKLSTFLFKSGCLLIFLKLQDGPVHCPPPPHPSTHTHHTLLLFLSQPVFPPPSARVGGSGIILLWNVVSD